MTILGTEIPSIPDVLIDDEKISQILLALKQIAEVREGRRGDVNQRFITYYEFINYLAGNDQITVIASSAGHNHDTLYSLLTHDHQGLYAKIVDVEGVYALLVHGHEDVYAAKQHEHDDYAKIVDVEGVFALAIHGHPEYSGLNHEHEGSAKLTDLEDQESIAFFLSL